MTARIDRRKLVRIAVATLVLGGGGYYAGAAVFGGDGDRTFYGSIDVRDVQLGFRSAGRVAEVLVEEGSQVAAGQVLARLDAEPYRRARAESAAARDAAAAHHALLSAGYDRHQVAEAEARVAELRATLTNATRTAERTTALLASGAQSQRAADDAIAQRDEAAARLHAGEQALARLRRGYRAEEIEEARAALARAEAAQAQADLRLEDTELRAPEAGIVQTRAVDPGSMVSAGATALVMTRTAETWVRAYVPGTLLGRAVPGAEVEVHTDIRERPYRARVGSVASQAEFTPKSVETTDLRTSLVYRVRLKVEDPDTALRQGMPVTLTFAAPEGR
jgi:HlyD family secretion protein